MYKELTRNSTSFKAENNKLFTNGIRPLLYLSISNQVVECIDKRKYVKNSYENALSEFMSI